MKTTLLKISILFVVLIITTLTIVFTKDDLPVIRAHITDETSTLSRGEIKSIEQMLDDFERESSTQIVVLMISSLEGQSLEEYSYRVAEKNKIGKKGKNNGVFLLIAKEDHKIRIEVGYGLEGVLTDALSSQIIRNIIVPRFREGKYFDGIKNGIEAIVAVTKGEYSNEDSGDNRSFFSLAFVIFFIIFFLIFSRILSLGKRSTISPHGYHSNYPWWGGFGGGGFSGGGGSFGGGGASGSW